VDTLLSVEETAFKRSLNDRIRGIWTRAKWPPLLTVVEKNVAAVDVATLKADKAVQIDNATDLFDVHGVYDRNPFQDELSKKIEHRLINGYLVLPADSTEDSIFVVGTLVPATDYGDGTLNIPAFMDRMLLAYCLSDYYRADGQNDKALAEEQRGEEYFVQELDRFERMESQNAITVNTYPTYYTSLLVRQTTI
jgi:hypothetical protein